MVSRSFLSRVLTVFVLAIVFATSVYAAEKTKLTFYPGWGTSKDTTFVTIARMFEKANPDIEIEMVNIPGDMEALTVQLVGGVAPDVYMVRSENMTGFVSKGLVLDLTEQYKKDIKLSDYLPGWGSMYFGGRFYGIPGDGGGYREDAMYVNRDIFNKSGINPPGPEINQALTFDQWTSLARKLTVDTNADGTPEQWGTHFRTTRWYFFLPSNGVSVFNENFTDTEIDSEAAVQVLDVLQKINTVHKVSAPNSYWFEDKGNVAMNILWRSRLAVTPQTIGSKFDWSLSPIPAGRAGSVGLTKMNPIAINPNTKYPEAAWRFLLYMMSEPAQRQQAIDDRSPMLRSVALDPKLVFFNKPPYNIMPFLGGNAVDATRQFEPTGVSHPKEVDSTLSKLWSGAIPAQSAAKLMADAWRAALKQRK